MITIYTYICVNTHKYKCTYIINEKIYRKCIKYIIYISLVVINDISLSLNRYYRQRYIYTYIYIGCYNIYKYFTQSFIIISRGTQTQESLVLGSAGGTPAADILRRSMRARDTGLQYCSLRRRQRSGTGASDSSSIHNELITRASAVHPT